MLQEQSLRELFESELQLIDDTIRVSCLRCSLDGQDAEDFRGWVYLRLIQDDYRILSQFEGRSSFATFINVVVRHLALDYQNKIWGKWRPTAAARRLGPTAVELERLVVRDGSEVREAFAVLLSLDHDLSEEELDTLAAQLPLRPRRRFEAPAVLDRMGCTGSVEGRVRSAERRSTVESVQKALRSALATLEESDRELVRRRFRDGQTISSIARSLDLDRRQLYTRMTRCLTRLRGHLERQGLSAPEVLGVLGLEESELHGLTTTVSAAR